MIPAFLRVIPASSNRIKELYVTFAPLSKQDYEDVLLQLMGSTGEVRLFGFNTPGTAFTGGFVNESDWPATMPAPAGFFVHFLPRELYRDARVEDAPDVARVFIDSLSSSSDIRLIYDRPARTHPGGGRITRG